MEIEEFFRTYCGYDKEDECCDEERENQGYQNESRDEASQRKEHEKKERTESRSKKPEYTEHSRIRRDNFEHSWVKMYDFDTLEEAEKFVSQNGTWVKIDKKPVPGGERVYYTCTQVSSMSIGCAARLLLEKPWFKNRLAGERICLFKNGRNHTNHVFDPNGGLPKDVEKFMRVKFFQGYQTPEQLSQLIQKEQLNAPNKELFLNYLRQLHKGEENEKKKCAESRSKKREDTGPVYPWIKTDDFGSLEEAEKFVSQNGTWVKIDNEPVPGGERVYYRCTQAFLRYGCAARLLLEVPSIENRSTGERICLFENGNDHTNHVFDPNGGLPKHVEEFMKVKFYQGWREPELLLRWIQVEQLNAPNKKLFFRYLEQLHNESAVQSRISTIVNLELEQ